MRTGLFVTASAALVGLHGACAFLAAPRLLQASRAVSSSRRSVVVMARKPLMAGNWKLNPATMDEAVSLAKAVRDP
jgi:hypothetical protein